MKEHHHCVYNWNLMVGGVCEQTGPDEPIDCEVGVVPVWNCKTIVFTTWD